MRSIDVKERAIETKGFGIGMNKKRKKIIESNQISEVQTVHLGKYDQKVLIEGKTAELPIVITLHGGPGTPIPFNVGGRGLFPEITEKCILVSWDQYGCGANHAQLPEDISIDSFVNMAEDLISYMKKRFPKNKCYLFAMSWGSVLSAKIAARNISNLDGVLVYGQVLHDLMRTECTIKTLMNSKAPQKVKDDIQGIISEKMPTYDTCIRMSKYVRKYTKGYSNPNEPKSPMGAMIWGMLTSPDYCFLDFMAIVKNGYMKNHSLVEELATINLKEDFKNISIPYDIIQGDTDIVTPTETVKEFVEELHKDNLKCIVVKDSAHMPGMNGMRTIMEILDRL